MPFIGVIAKENDCNYIRNEIIKLSKKMKYEIIIINKKSISNIRNIMFDIIVINENIKEIIKESKYIEDLINKAKFILMNTDIQNNLSFKRQSCIKVITYGMNSKSTVTVSSIKDNNIMMCIQRKIVTINKQTIDEQDININVNKYSVNKIYNILIINTILLIYGEKTQ